MWGNTFRVHVPGCLSTFLATYIPLLRPRDLSSKVLIFFRFCSTVIWLSSVFGQFHQTWNGEMFLYQIVVELVVLPTPNNSKLRDTYPFPSHPPSIFSQLEPSYRTGLSLKKLRRINPQLQQLHTTFRDPRLGRISIDWIDFGMESQLEAQLPELTDGRERGSDGALRVAGEAHTIQGNLGSFSTEENALSVPFCSGRSLLNSGIIHLFREKEPLVASSDGPEAEASQTVSPSSTLCLLNVPAYMTAQDFLRFVAPYSAAIAHVRFLRDALLSRALVLIDFRVGNAFEGEPEAFYNEFSGRKYNSLDSTAVCSVIYVKNVEFKSHTFPHFTLPQQSLLQREVGSLTSPNVPVSPKEKAASPSASSSSTPAPSPTIQTKHGPGAVIATSPGTRKNSSDSSAMIELPTCPVCLDRMDASVTGLVTILCHHTFHCNCLSKWQDASCPVCRYTSASLNHNLSSPNIIPATFGTESLLGVPQNYPHQQQESPGSTPSTNHSQLALASEYPHASGTPSNKCASCAATSNLWICLICGNVGCGRYESAHAAQHYGENPAHLYALELETQRVWDYAGDGYVHRLIRTGKDGQGIVELSAPAHASVFGDQRSRRRGRGKQGVDTGGRQRRGDEEYWSDDGPRRRNRHGDDGSDHFSFRGDGEGRGNLKGKGEEFSDEEDELGIEYSVLLSSQLESQRRWYEEQMNALVVEHASKTDSIRLELDMASEANRRLESQLAVSAAHAMADRKKLEDVFLRDRERLERKLDKCMERVGVLERAFGEERGINEGLRDNQDVLKLQMEAKERELEEKRKQVDELSEQVRDLMFYLETQQKVNESPLKNELQNGMVVIEQQQEIGESSGKGKVKKKKNKN
ncbi:hypothetical protein BC830DRAFT_783412 [Chytriomyces sp. MP71]|nr:hypothetical protein BC830DRAFT_783412 [Chytriomyces sp. MP71]